MAVERIRHRLATALRFVDAFTARSVTVPLDVRAEALPIVPGMPTLPWRAARGPNDDSYRLLVSNDTAMPAGTVTVDVSAPGGQYFNFEPLVVTLPRPLVAHPPTPARSDYLIQHTLWPTRSLKLPPGETVITGRFTSGGVSPVARLKVTIWLDGTPMPPAPYSYSTDRGELVHRLPSLKTVVGGVFTATASLQMNVALPPLYTTPAAPVQITDDAGVILTVPFAIRLGQVTNLAIALP
jgi:hypothetical protein